MEPFALAFLGGLLGALLMDITETSAARVGVSSGVSVALIGRWVLGWRHGRLRHADIRQAPALPAETAIGWAFHVLIGGGGVALLYPLLFTSLFTLPAGLAPIHHLVGGLLFGLATSVLPWFVLLPCFGWGIWGRRGPPGSDALLASTLSHLPYGLGVGLVMAFGS